MPGFLGIMPGKSGQILKILSPSPDVTVGDDCTSGPKTGSGFSDPDEVLIQGVKYPSRQARYQLPTSSRRCPTEKDEIKKWG